MIKEIFKVIIPKKIRQVAKNRILVVISFIYRIFQLKSKINTKLELFSIGYTNTNTFFGYYDITPFNNNDEIVYLELPDDSPKANIIFNSTTLEKPTLIATTNAWNWQQGSRLRWLPGSDSEIVFNDFINGEYNCRILNIKTNANRIINTPIYDISPNGKYGITLNFERLGVLRPGYGYTNKPYCDQYDLSEESIHLVDMNTGEKEILTNYKTIANIMQQPVNDYHPFYINHLSFSPDGQKVMFLWIEIIETWHQASLLVYDFNKKKINVLEKELKSSHYVWQDNNSILCAGYNHTANSNICRFYLYNTNDDSKQIVCPNILQWDGHPVYLTEDIILIDTYPNRYAYQKLFLINLATGKQTKLVEIYSVPRKKEEERTDLHPRLNKAKNIICFDANVYGKRRLYFLKGWK
jgi:hypothetical protein